jgi:hypothetical protein
VSMLVRACPPSLYITVTGNDRSNVTGLAATSVIHVERFHPAFATRPIRHLSI